MPVKKHGKISKNIDQKINSDEMKKGFRRFLCYHYIDEKSQKIAKKISLQKVYIYF